MAGIYQRFQTDFQIPRTFPHLKASILAKINTEELKVFIRRAQPFSRTMTVIMGKTKMAHSWLPVRVNGIQFAETAYLNPHVPYFIPLRYRI